MRKLESLAIEQARATVRQKMAQSAGSNDKAGAERLGHVLEVIDALKEMAIVSVSEDGSPGLTITDLEVIVPAKVWFRFTEQLGSEAQGLDAAVRSANYWDRLYDAAASPMWTDKTLTQDEAFNLLLDSLKAAEAAGSAIERQAAEIDRLNTELDAMAQRAVSPTFDPNVPWKLEDLKGSRQETGDTIVDDGNGGLVAAPITPEPVAVPAPIPYQDKPPVAMEEGVPATWPGRSNPEPPRVTLGKPVEAPRKPTLDDRIEAIRRLAEGEGRADIASALGLKSAAQVHGLTLQDKRRIQRLKESAPHDREALLAQIRKELGGTNA